MIQPTFVFAAATTDSDGNVGKILHDDDYMILFKKCLGNKSHIYLTPIGFHCMYHIRNVWLIKYPSDETNTMNQIRELVDNCPMIHLHGMKSGSYHYDS